MLGQVHDHIVSELGESSRTDTIFVLTAIIFNLIVLGINFGVATEVQVGVVSVAVIGLAAHPVRVRCAVLRANPARVAVSTQET